VEYRGLGGESTTQGNQHLFELLHTSFKFNVLKVLFSLLVGVICETLFKLELNDVKFSY
jgi:type III secretory pathway component EscU